MTVLKSLSACILGGLAGILLGVTCFCAGGGRWFGYVDLDVDVLVRGACIGAGIGAVVALALWLGVWGSSEPPSQPPG